MKIGGTKRYRGIGETNLERLDQDFVEVPSKRRINQDQSHKKLL
jgi:hypothetical protein